MSGYDNWKTTEPEPYDDGSEPRGYCDCCDKYRPLSRCWASGIETFACDECRGIEPDEDDDDEQQRHEYVSTLRPSKHEPDPDYLRDKQRDDALWDKQNSLPTDDEPF